MNTTLWILTAFIGLVLVLNRKKIFKHAFRWLAPRNTTERWNALATREDIAELSATTADAVVARVLERVAQEAEAHYLETLSKLRAEVLALRMRLRELQEGWVTIGIHVRGFNMGVEDKCLYYALIQISPRSGELRAHPESNARKLIKAEPERARHYALSFEGHMFSNLGAPWYGRVHGDPNSISMLGETYTIRDL